MTDVHSREVRSHNMASIKSKDTKPEIMVRKFLFSKGFRFRVNVKSLPGKPDIVLKKYRTVIFVNGCFWHGHEGCKYFVIPQTRTEWWMEKIRKNKERDSEEREKLRNAGWNIIVVWECQLKPKQREDTLSGIESLLQQFFLNMNRKKVVADYPFPMVAEPEEEYKRAGNGEH